MSRQGMVWEQYELAALIRMFDEQTPLEEMSTRMERTPAAIVGKLVQLKKLVQIDWSYYVVGAPYVRIDRLQQLNDAMRGRK